MSVHFSSVYI